MAGYLGTKATFLSTTAGVVTGDMDVGGDISATDATFSGDVGIGTDAPDAKLDVNGNVAFGDGGGFDMNATGTRWQFSLNNTEAMRLDSSGNLLVGKTAADVNSNGVELLSTGRVNVRIDEGPALDVRRATGSTSELFAVFRDGNTGMIKIGESGNAGYIEGATGDTGLKFEGSHIRPRDNQTDADNAVDLGNSSYRFDDIYATNGNINTSDANEKQQINTLNDVELAAAKTLSGLFKNFKWNDSVAEKGDDARTHTGVIAQEVEQALTDAGLDAGDYAFLTSTDWVDEETGEQRNRKGIRYPQLLSFVAAATEQRLNSIEARLEALEAL